MTYLIRYRNDKGEVTETPPVETTLQEIVDNLDKLGGEKNLVVIIKVKG